jgi:hypothetical protein
MNIETVALVIALSAALYAILYGTFEFMNELSHYFRSP